MQAQQPLRSFHGHGLVRPKTSIFFLGLADVKRGRSLAGGSVLAVIVPRGGAGRRLSTLLPGSVRRLETRFGDTESTGGSPGCRPYHAGGFSHSVRSGSHLQLSLQTWSASRGTTREVPKSGCPLHSEVLVVGLLVSGMTSVRRVAATRPRTLLSAFTVS